MTDVTTRSDPADAVRAMEAQLAATPRAVRPAQHAVIRYRLGMALAELPTGDRQLNLSRAVRHYDQAISLFRVGPFALEHARVHNARGAALRELGRPADAAEACRSAAAIIPEDAPGWERGAALNNLALALSDMGHHDEAVDLLGDAIDLFDDSVVTVEQIGPQRIMAHHNLGQVMAAAGRHAEAVTVYRQAIEQVDEQTLPFQWGLLHHALGVSLTGLADPQDAVAAFSDTLRVFSRVRHPFQHALAKNNLGLAWAQVGTATGLRHAVVAFTDSLAVLDSTVHRPLWQQAYTNLEAARQALVTSGSDNTPTGHLVDLAAESTEAVRDDLLQDRITRVLALPDPRRTGDLAEIVHATLAREESGAISVLTAFLTVLLELPDEQLMVGLGAVLGVMESLADDQAKDDAGWILDQAISRGMLAPQRIRVHDSLTAMGHERR